MNDVIAMISPCTVDVMSYVPAGRLTGGVVFPVRVE